MMVFLYFREDCLNIQFKDFILEIAFMAAGVAIGSKFLFILTKIPDMIDNFSVKYVIVTIITSGFVFYGGLFGAIIGMLFFSKCKKIHFKELADTVAPGFPLFHMWGRIGCFFAGCCYGKKADWGFALESEPDVLRIPIQLIESFFLFLIFLSLLIIERRFQKHYNLLYLYLLLYSIIRIGTECFRGDAIRGTWMGISTSQWISLLLILYLLILRVQKREHIMI